MQPDEQQHADDTWKAPEQAPSQAPYVAPAEPQVEAPIQPASLPPEEVPETPLLSEQSEAQDNATQQDDDAVPVDQDIDETAVRWQAHEYIHREKDMRWYIAFGVIVVALMAIAIFVMNAWTFAVLVLVMAVTLIMYTRRPPRVLDYILSRQGLHINDRLYPFVEFKSFIVIHGDDEYSIMLVPVKRFQPGVSVYFPEESGEAIVDMLAARMPMQESQLDLMDRIIRRLRI